MDPKQPSIIEQSFCQHFFQAEAVSVEISLRARSLEDVSALDDLLDMIRDEMDIMDENAKKQLDALRVELDKRYKVNKEAIEADYARLGKDAILKNSEHQAILREKHARYKRELREIKKLAYLKGWMA